MASLNQEAVDVLVDYYYPRASWLQDNCNWGKLSYTGEEANEVVDDDLMQLIEIYDCKTRNAAGFSNVLQDLWFGGQTPKYHHMTPALKLQAEMSNKKPMDAFMFAAMVHRLTGSGASFEDDHGYRNSRVQKWGQLNTIPEMVEDLKYVRENKITCFTSIGNQPPAPKKGVSNLDFMIEELPDLINKLWLAILEDGPWSHKQVVDYLNDYNVSQGHRRFNFQYSAFSMDLSDYYPEMVDPDSHVYIGNNAKRCVARLSSGWRYDDFFDMLRERTGGRPKDLEDVTCDFVRFGQNYVPRGNGTYDYVPFDIKNNSGWESGWRQRQGD